MLKLAIVTYTRKNEYLTKELLNIGNLISKEGYNVIMEWYSESTKELPKEDGFLIIQTVMDGTKFSKLINILTNKNYDYIISLDNDINASESGLIKLVNETISNDYDISWGRVYSREVNNITSNLVKVDKLLSHNILRPALWMCNLGVTIPGQCFMLKVECFKNKLPETNTFLDDLSIGLFAAKNKLKYLYLNEVVVKEIPSYSFSSLLKQRSRWAIGYKQSLACPTLMFRDKYLLLIHGFSYHILPLLHLSLLVLLFTYYPLLFLFTLLLTASIISLKDYKSFPYAIIYQIIFPIFHIQWLQKIIKSKL